MHISVICELDACIYDAGFFVTNERTNEPTDKAILGVGFKKKYLFVLFAYMLHLYNTYFSIFALILGLTFSCFTPEWYFVFISSSFLNNMCYLLLIVQWESSHSLTAGCS